MDKITFQGKKLSLIGQVNLKGKKLGVIKALDKNGEVKFIKDFKSDIKVISSFPKLNTSVCDHQTKKIAEMAAKNQNISFISITMDSVKTINKWCLSNSLTNIEILSDQEYQSFAKATNLLIKKLKMLARGFIILDKDNIVVDYFYQTEITDKAMFDALEKAIVNF